MSTAAPTRRRGVTPTGVAAWVLAAGALTSTWGALAYRGVPLMDIALAVATILAVADGLARGSRLQFPRAVWWTGYALALLTTWHALMPVGQAYLRTRGLQQTGSGAVNGIQWMLAAVVLPVVVALMVQQDPRHGRRLLIWWVAGTGISALFALSDYLGLTSVATDLTGIVRGSSRQQGLSNHPNILGVACVMAVPFVLLLFMRHLLWGLLLLVPFVGGVVVSGSRGAQAGLLVAIGFTIGFVAVSRRAAVRFSLIAFALAGMTYWLMLTTSTSDLLRVFAPEQAVAASDHLRETRAATAIADFLHRPLTGIGFEFATSGHNIALQTVASGGLILTVALVAYFAAVLRTGARLRSTDTLVAASFVAVISWLAMGMVENTLLDRFLYIPVAVILAVAAARADAPAGDVQPDAGVRRSPERVAVVV